MKANPIQVITNLWNWIKEREEAKICLINTLTSMCNTLDNYLDKPQDPTTTKQHSTPKNKYNGSHQQDRGKLLRIWLPYTLHLRLEKTNYPENPTSLITRTIISIMRNIYLSPDNTVNLCGGIPEGPHWSKICYNPSCAAVNHPKSITDSLLPFHAYLMLPGSFVIHPLPLLCYKDFTQNTITKVNQTFITA